MKKIKESLKYIKIKDILSFFVFLLMIIPSLFFRLYLKIRKRKLILVTEGAKTARDNGYHFYKYVRINHPDDYCFYVIDKKCNDYNKVKEFGNIIQYGSLKHWLYYMSAKYNVSNQKFGNPNTALFYVIHVIFRLYNNRVFLQHGITKDDSPWLYYKNCRFKYFICGAKLEYEYIKEKFGYPDKNLLYTGFARFDTLYNNNINKKQILIMPTWRNWLGRVTNSFGEKINFKETDYYQKWNGLLNDSVFINFIEKNELKILFYPHQHMQKFLHDFEVKSNNIEIVSMNTDIQTVLKESAILITDYSSVYMDFAYMQKPVIYYQFDYDEYRKKQLKQGYFDYQNDGFGPVAYKQDELINLFISIYKNGIEKKYADRMNKFFEIRDQKNCERIYNSLK